MSDDYTVQSGHNAVRIDDGPSFPAVVESETWNGWARPRFTVDTVNRIIAEYSDGANQTIEWAGPTRVRVTCHDTDEIEHVDQGDDLLFALGAGSWCWEVADHE